MLRNIEPGENKIHFFFSMLGKRIYLDNIFRNAFCISLIEQEREKVKKSVVHICLAISIWTVKYLLCKPQFFFQK